MPVDSRPIRVSLPPTILYDATVFQCGDRIKQKVVSMRGAPVIDLWASTPGRCIVTFHTSRRTYSLDFTIKEYTVEKPIAPVATIRWDS